MAIKRSDVMKHENMKGKMNFEEAINEAKKRIKFPYEAEKKLTLLCITHRQLSDKEIEESVYNIAELIAEDFCKNVKHFIKTEELNKFSSKLEEYRKSIIKTQINFIKTKFNEWDNE